MVKEDYENLAQCCHSLVGKIDAAELDRFLDRLIWAIHASPGGSREFNHQAFVRACKGDGPVIADLVAALRTSDCPHGPPDDLTVSECIAQGKCDCDCGPAIAKASGVQA